MDEAKRGQNGGLGAGEPGLGAALPYLMAFMAFGLSVSVTGPTLPGLAARAAVPLSQLGFLFAARSVGGILGAAGVGAWVDRGGGTRAVAASLAAGAVATAVGPLVPRLSLYLLLWFAQGLATGAVNAGGNTLLLWTYPAGRVAPYLNAVHFSFGLGSTLAPLLVVPLLGRSDGLVLAYVAAGLVLLPGAVALWRTPAPPPPPAAARTSAPPTRAKGPFAALVGAFLVLVVGCEVAFGGWIFSYAQGTGLATVAAAAYLNAALWASFTGARLLAIPLAARYSPERLLTVALAGGVASLGLLSLFPGSRSALWIGTIGFGSSIAPVFPNTLLLAGRRRGLTGRRSALLFCLSGVGGMLLPAVFGGVCGWLGPRTAMPVLLGALALGAALFAALAAAGRGEGNVGRA